MEEPNVWQEQQSRHVGYPQQKPPVFHAASDQSHYHRAERIETL